MTGAHDVHWSGAHWYCQTCRSGRLINLPIPGTFDKRPICPNDKESMAASDNPCKNCHQPTHPHYIHKYGGYCLDCSNAGVRELRERIAELEAKAERMAVHILKLEKLAGLAPRRAKEALTR